jgi:hypothetical protein
VEGAGERFGESDGAGLRASGGKGDVRTRVWPVGPTWQLRTHTQVLATGPKVSAPTLERAAAHA